MRLFGGGLGRRPSRTRVCFVMLHDAGLGMLGRERCGPGEAMARKQAELMLQSS